MLGSMAGIRQLVSLFDTIRIDLVLDCLGAGWPQRNSRSSCLSLQIAGITPFRTAIYWSSLYPKPKLELGFKFHVCKYNIGSRGKLSWRGSGLTDLL